MINKAIKLAIEKGGYVKGGWDSGIKWNPKFGENGIKSWNGSLPVYIAYAEIILDPEFWQSLGKALGWEEDEVVPYDLSKLDKFEWIIRFHRLPRWRFNAQRYFDLVLTGGDTEKFWNNLLV